MRSLLRTVPLIGAVLLSGAPVFADDMQFKSDVFKMGCMGSEKMDDDYRIQKAKYCDCMAEFIFIEKTEKSLMEVSYICKDKYPPLN